MGKPFDSAPHLIALAFVALALTASAPAYAQFMTSYPIIVVPPAQSQTVIAPKRPPTARDRENRQDPNPAGAPDETHCRYQGQTRVCD